MKVTIVPYIDEIHGNFVKGYLVQYLQHGFLYDVDATKRQILATTLLRNLPQYTTYVAVDSEDSSVFLGFIIAEEHILHKLKFIYVKKHYQQKGIGKALLVSAIDLILREIEIPVKSPSLNQFFKKLGLKAVVRYYEAIQG